jgi:hypothetical protein
MQLIRVVSRLSLACLITLLASAAFAGEVHQHGVARLNLVLDKDSLLLFFETPLENLVGFERAPRTESERKAAAAALGLLRAGDDLFRPNQRARCVFENVRVDANLLERSLTGVKTPATSADEHAELTAQYQFKCAQPSALSSLGVHLFQSFERMTRVDVQSVLPGRQKKTILTRPARGGEVQSVLLP